MTVFLFYFFWGGGETWVRVVGLGKYYVLPNINPDSKCPAIYMRVCGPHIYVRGKRGRDYIRVHVSVHRSIFGDELGAVPRCGFISCGVVISTGYVFFE